MDDFDDIIQGTDAWKQVRCGRLTASRVAEAIAKTKNGWGASRANLMAELVCERLTGVPADKYTNAAMQYGIEMEPLAREAYETATFNTVRQVGFVSHPSIPNFGCSPDGLIDKDGLVEFKVPLTSTHIDTLLTETIPSKYLIQIQVQISCTGREWCDYCSFDPRMPTNMQLFIKRVIRNQKQIIELEIEAAEFLGELDAKLELLKRKFK